jgi:hypothetical protein
MHLHTRSAGWLALLTLLPTLPGIAQEHVVPQAEIQQRAVQASQERQKNLEELNSLFAREAVSKVLDVARVRQAVSLLNDDELARLSARARAIKSDFAAGALTNQELTYIIIALGTAVLILVIVAAR